MTSIVAPTNDADLALCDLAHSTRLKLPTAKPIFRVDAYLRVRSIDVRSDVHATGAANRANGG